MATLGRRRTQTYRLFLNRNQHMSSTDSVTVVIATFNEIDSLPILVQRIWNHLPTAQILVVDDNSPDGTGQWVETMANQQSRISLLHRPCKEGLGKAAISGLSEAIQFGADWIATMDADLSHDPVDLPDMLAHASPNDGPAWDVVIGSRYVTGGTIENWPFTRRITSRVVNAVARYGLGLKPHDCSGAYRIYRREALEQIDLEQIRSCGHVYLEEILMLLQRNGASITEYPITFRDRTIGHSTIGPSGLWFNARELIRLLVFRR